MGRNTTWPHNPRTGWSYCVMIPSWTLREPGTPNDGFLNPIIFYRIHVGIQSPEGVSSIHEVLRRFSDFLKFYSALKRSFPKKDIPPAPPKNSFSRINSSRLLLEERRRALEEWIGKLLSDIDLSRSATVAGFLELEAAARSSFQDATPETSSLENANTISSSLTTVRPSSSASYADYSTVSSKPQSVSSEIGSDNVYETTDIGTPGKGKVHAIVSSREDLPHNNDSSTLGATSNGVLGESILDQSDTYVISDLQHAKDTLVLERDDYSGNHLKATSLYSENLDSMSKQDHHKLFGHARKNSAESIGSDISSIRGSELSVPGVTNSIWDSATDLPGGAEASNYMEALTTLERQFQNDAQIVLPLDQRHKLNRLLVTVQRRVVTTKTDMEDLIARLNQEMAVKEYLTTKVKDLEVELEVTKQKGRETLQEAILVERERVTQMQWDMDEIRRKYSEMESKFKFEQIEKTRVESEKETASGEKESLIQELESKKEELKSMQRHLEEVEMKSKADIKVLVKEVKFLRNSQAELKEVLNRNLKEKTELERVLHNEKQKREHAKLAWRKLLHECRILRDRLQECSVNFPLEEDKFIMNHSSFPDALDLLATSDNRIGLLLAEVLEKVLEASGNDLDSAIKGINKLQSGSEGRNLGLATSKYLPDDGTNVTVSLEADYDGGMAAHRSLTENIPTDGSGWVDLFVREISTASNLADARHRAFKLLEILEKSIVVHTGSGPAESFHKENKKLEEQVEALLRENSVLKRAVAIQHERQKDYDEKSQQLQHLKQTVFQYQEQIRTLEVNNYALTMHMYRAQQNSPISGHFHPDVF